MTLGFSASVATEAVANRSSWDSVPPGRSCAEANLGEFAASQVLILTLTLTLILTPTLALTLALPLALNPSLTLTLTLTPTP